MPEANPQQDNSFDEYDHDFEPFEVCVNCDETHENCECDEFEPKEMPDIDECNDCGLPESDPIHVSGE